MAKIDISNKDAIKNINEIIDSFNKMRTALTGVGDGSKASFRKMSTGLSNLKQLNQQVISQLGVLSNAYKNVSKSQKSFVTQTRNLKQELAKTNQQIYFLDFDNIIRNVSRSEIFSERNWYFGRHRLTSLGLKLVIEELLVFLQRKFRN